MPGIFQQKRAVRAELGDAGIVLAGKFRLGEGKVQLAQNLGGPNQVVAPLPQLAAEFSQDALYFGEFPVLEFHQFIVQGQGFHRLEIHGCPGRACTVDYTLHAPLLLHSHGNHEPVVPKRHHGILEHSLLAEAAQQTLEHRLHFHPQTLDGSPNPRQFRTGGGIHRAVRVDLSIQFRDQVAEVCQAARQLLQAGQWALGKQPVNLERRARQSRKSKDLQRLQGRALDAEFLEQRPRVSKASQTWSRTLPQIFACFLACSSSATD